MRAVRERLEAGERPACRWLGVNRKLFHTRSCDRADEPLRLRLIALALDHRRYGFPRLTVLRREGFTDNRKRIYRVYVGAHLQVHKRVKRKLALGRGPVDAPASAPNDRWSAIGNVNAPGLR